jgi:hypothetical protein
MCEFKVISRSLSIQNVCGTSTLVRALQFRGDKVTLARRTDGALGNREGEGGCRRVLSEDGALMLSHNCGVMDASHNGAEFKFVWRLIGRTRFSQGPRLRRCNNICLALSLM